MKRKQNGSCATANKAVNKRISNTNVVDLNTLPYPHLHPSLNKVKVRDVEGNNPKQSGHDDYLTESDTDDENVRINGRQVPESYWKNTVPVPTSHKMVLDNSPNDHTMQGYRSAIKDYLKIHGRGPSKQL